jgi:branched-chain amino acid transport system ATP-binding protein
MTPLLAVRDLTVRYGKVLAVEEVSLTVAESSIVAILGANGAGKSSTLNAITGNLVGSVRGEVELAGRRIAGLKAHTVARHGMVLVPEGRQIVAPLTVEENLMLGNYLRRTRRKFKQIREQVFGMFPVLYERRRTPAGLLSGGEQQMLAFGRALMADPTLIVLDEPSMGLSPAMVSQIMGSVTQLRNLGLTVLLVEQNAAAALTIADDVYVLDGGRITIKGSAQEIRDDPQVSATFLGLGREAA